LAAMCRMLGLTPLPMFPQLELQLRHHVTGLRREDRELLWEGLDGLSKKELVDYCKARGIRFDVSKEQMREWLGYWLELSSHKDIDIALLLWCQTFFISKDEYKIAMAVGPSKLGTSQPEVPLKVQEDEPAEQAFTKIKERGQTRLAEAEEQLLQLRQELETMKEKDKNDEVSNVGSTEDDVPDEKASTDGAASVVAEDTTIDEELPNYSTLEVTKLGKCALIEEIALLEGQRDTAQRIVEKQHLLLKKQLQFLSHMRKNEPTVNKDPDAILFDQRTRLIEMFNQFNTDFKNVEEELEHFSSTQSTGRNRSVEASVKRFENASHSEATA